MTESVKSPYCRHGHNGRDGCDGAVKVLRRTGDDVQWAAEDCDCTCHAVENTDT